MYELRVHAVLSSGMVAAAIGVSVLTAAVAVADDVILPVGPNGVTYIRTESGRTLCGIEGDVVRCTVQFVDPFMTGSGDLANSVALSRDGSLMYAAADLGQIDPVNTVEYGQSYLANGWAVDAASDGTRFMNINSSQSFWVSVDGASSLGMA
jgi:hypothetical protein